MSLHRGLVCVGPVLNGVNPGLDGQPGAFEAVAVGGDLEASLVRRPHRDIQRFPRHAGELLTAGLESGGAHLYQACAPLDHILDTLQQLFWGFRGPGEACGPRAWELKPLAGCDDTGPRNGSGGRLLGYVDVDGVASPHISGRGYTGHQGPAAVPDCLEGEFLGGVVQQAFHGVHATVTGKVFVAINQPRDQG